MFLGHSNLINLLFFHVLWQLLLHCWLSHENSQCPQENLWTNAIHSDPQCSCISLPCRAPHTQMYYSWRWSSELSCVPKSEGDSELWFQARFGFVFVSGSFQSFETVTLLLFAITILITHRPYLVHALLKHGYLAERLLMFIQ